MIFFDYSDADELWSFVVQTLNNAFGASDLPDGRQSLIKDTLGVEFQQT